MKVLFVWTGVTSYMADCWRELSNRDGIELRVVIVRHVSGSEIDVGGVLRGFDASVVDDGCIPNMDGWTPDIVFAVGWRSVSVRRIIKNRQLHSVPKVCCFDMPWRWELRCLFARWVLGGFLRRYDAAFVPGARASRYAMWLGFRKIYRGLFSLNAQRFNGIPGKKDFMFIGRNAPEKRIDLLNEAYSLYRKMGGSWSFDIYGGSNFVQPSEVPNLYKNHACLLLASSFDPWPLVMLEATAAGLTVVASNRCGNVEELGAKSVRYGDPQEMSEAMIRVERGEIQPAGRSVALQYDSTAWADRVQKICDDLTGR